MTLLVHSCEGRGWILRHWFKFFRRSGWDIPVEVIGGKEKFTNQLYRVLPSMDEYFFYMLDDFFIKHTIDFDYYMDCATLAHMGALRLQPNVQYNSLPYRFEAQLCKFLKQSEDSRYKMSLQASIWRRDYFIECLKPDLDPWQFELADCELQNVYFAPELPRWYIDATRKGILRTCAKKMIYDT